MAGLMDDVQGFIFGGNTGLTYEGLKRRQAIAQALASRNRGFPKTIGEGIASLGSDIGDIIADRKLRADEAGIEKKRAAEIDKLTGATGSAEAVPPVAAPPVAAAPPAAAPAVAPAAAPVAPPVNTARVAPAAPPAGLPLDPTPARDRITDAATAQMFAKAGASAPPEVVQPNPTLPGAQPPVDAMSFLPQEQKPTISPSMPSAFRNLGGQQSDPLWPRRMAAISGIESGGEDDPYRAIGPRSKTGDHAYGKYQMMGANIPQWSQAALGRPVSIKEFLDNDQIQDAIFQHRFGQYVAKYGEAGAARAWFAGEGNMNNLKAKDRNGTTVGAYGRDYMQRFGGAGDSGSDVDAGAGAVDGVNVYDDEGNPPTLTAIQPAPTPRGPIPGSAAPLSDLLSKAPMMPPASGAPAATAAPPAAAPSDEAFVMDKPIAPAPPARIPESEREARARAVLLRATDPYLRQAAESVVQREAEKRKFDQDRLVTKYNADVQQYERDIAKYNEQVATQRERTLELQKKRDEAAKMKDEAATRATYGTLPSYMVEDLTKRRDTANASVVALDGLRNAREAIAAGALFGPEAYAQLLYHKARAAIGNKESARIIAATESFESNMGGAVAQAIKQYAGKDVSQSELKYVRDIQGGSIGLNAETVKRMLEISERAARGTISDHRDYIDRVLKSQPSAVRDAFDVGRSREPVPVGGGKELAGKDKEAFDWAVANPNDPRAVEIRKRLGR